MIAAAALGEPGTHEEATRVLLARVELHAPSHWKAEFANVVWKAVRLSRLAPERVEDVLNFAESLPIIPHEIGDLWRGAVARAIRTGHPAYDTLFVELADRLGSVVVSYDAQLRARFPEFVKRPRDTAIAP